MEVLTHLEANEVGCSADVSLIEDNKYVFIDNDLMSNHSPYNMLLKSAKFGPKG